MSNETELHDSLSDDAFMDQFESIVSTPADDSAEEPEGTDSDLVADDADESDVDTDETNADTDAFGDDEDDSEDDEVPAESDEESEEDPVEEKPTESADVDYQAEYQKLLAPFKASGREMSVRNVDEAIRLMQMGADYQKKMGSLKPGLKTLKLLQNHELLEPAKVSLMIDAAKGNKAAIAQLMKNSGIDPLDLDMEAETSYQPTNYSVDDKELVFDEVVERIQHSPTYRQTINLVGNIWDEESRKIVADNPHLLEVIDTQMNNGVYELVRNEVDRERLMGRLNGLSDIVAYKQIGDAMEKRGAFNHLFKQTPAAKPIRKVVTKPNSTTSEKSSQKKRAAAPSRKQPPQIESLDDVLKLSDAEYMRRYG